MLLEKRSPPLHSKEAGRVSLLEGYVEALGISRDRDSHSRDKGTKVGKVGVMSTMTLCR